MKRKKRTSIGDPKTARLSIRITEDLARALEERARKEERSVSNLVQRLLDKTIHEED